MAQIDRLTPMAGLEPAAIPFSFPKIDMEIVSRVFWEESRIKAYERLLTSVSPPTVEALKHYTWNKDLFQV